MRGSPLDPMYGVGGGGVVEVEVEGASQANYFQSEAP